MRSVTDGARDIIRGAEETRRQTAGIFYDAEVGLSEVVRRTFNNPILQGHESSTPNIHKAAALLCLSEGVDWKSKVLLVVFSAGVVVVQLCVCIAIFVVINGNTCNGDQSGCSSGLFCSALKHCYLRKITYGFREGRLRLACSSHLGTIL